jgi:hypothetical protein
MAEEVLTEEVSAGPTSIADAFENYDFNWDTDDGELEITKTEEEASEETEELETSEEETTEETAETKTETEETQETAPAAESAELTALKEQVAKLTQKLEEKGDEKTQTQQEEPASDPLEDVIPEDADLAEIFTDVEQTKTLFKNVFVKMIEKTLLPYQTMLQHYQVTQELRAAFQKYPDFEEKAPLIRDILAEQPNLDLDTAYKMVSKFAPATTKQEETSKQSESESTAESEKAKASEEKVAPKLSAEELKEKAAKLKTEQGVSGKRSSGGAATSVADAFNQALEETLG